MSTLQCLAYIRSELDPEAAGDSDVRGGVFMVRGCKHSQTAPQRVGFVIMIYIKIVLVTLLCQVRADINIDTNECMNDPHIHWHCWLLSSSKLKTIYFSGIFIGKLLFELCQKSTN